MAQEIGTAYVRVMPSGKGFGKSIEGDIAKASESGSRKGSNAIIGKLGGAFGKIGKIGTGAITTIAGGITALAAKGGFERALNIENAKAKLKGLGHDAGSVTEIMNDALASVKGTAFGLGDAATVAASLSASGVKEGEQLTKVLKTVADTAQISGRSLTDIGTIFGSVAARGKLQGDDMLQLMSSGIPVLQMLGKHLNKTSADVSDMVSKGKIDFQTFADAMQEGLGGAALSAGTTFSGALSNVKAALSRLGETAATPFLNGMRSLFNQAIPLIDAFGAKVTPTLEQVGGKVQKGLETAIPTVQSFFAALSSNPAVQRFAADVTALVAAVGRFAAGMGQVSAPLAQLSSLLPSLDALLSAFMHTVTSLLDAASAQSSALQPLVGQLLPELVSLLGQLMTAATGALGYVSAHADTFLPLAEGIAALVLASRGLGALTGWLQSIPALLAGFDGAARCLAGVVDNAVQLGSVTPIIRQFASGLKIVTAAQAAFKAVCSAASAVTTLFAGVLGTAAGPIVAVVAGFAALVAAGTWFFTQTEVGRQAWASFTSFLSSAWQVVVSTVVSIGQNIANFFTSTLPTAIQAAIQWFAQLPAQVGQFFETLPETIAYWLGFGVTTIVLYAAQWGAQAVQMGSQFIANVGTFLQQLPGRIGAWLAATVIGIGSWAVQTAAQASQAGSQFITNVAQFLQQLPSRLGTWLLATIARIVSFASQMGAKAREAGRSFKDNLVNAVTSLPGRMLSIGANIVDGIINGIKSKVAGIGSALLGGVNDAISAVKSKLGIHSPSRLMRDQVGVMIGRGLALGIDDSAGIVSRSMTGLVSGMSLDGLDATDTGGVDVSGATGDPTGADVDRIVRAIESLHADLGRIIAEYAPAMGDRDFARKVRNAIA